MSAMMVKVVTTLNFGADEAASAACAGWLPSIRPAVAMLARASDRAPSRVRRDVPRDAERVHAMAGEVARWFAPANVSLFML